MIKLATFISLFLISIAGRASEGMASQAAYFCDPVPLTQAMVAHCVERVPELASLHGMSFANWEKRNHAAINELTGQCKSEAKERAKSESEYKTTMSFIKKLNNEGILSKLKEIDENSALCNGLLVEIDSGKADLQGFVLKRK